MRDLVIAAFADELEKLASLAFPGIPLIVKSSLGKGHPPTSKDVLRTIRESLAQWKGGMEGISAIPEGATRRAANLRSNVRVRFPDIKDQERLLAILKEEGAVGLHGGIAPASSFVPMTLPRFAARPTTTTATLPSRGILAPSGPVKPRQIGY